MRLTRRGRLVAFVAIMLALFAGFLVGSFGLADTCWHPETTSYGTC